MASRPVRAVLPRRLVLPAGERRIKLLLAEAGLDVIGGKNSLGDDEGVLQDSRECFAASAHLDFFRPVGLNGAAADRTVDKPAKHAGFKLPSWAIQLVCIRAADNFPAGLAIDPIALFEK